MRLKLLFLRSFPKQDLNYIKAELSAYYQMMIPNDFSRQCLIELGKKADVFIGSKIFRNLIEAAGNLKLIQVPSAGVDQIDFDLLKGREIIVCNSHSNSPYVAEHAIALMFSLVKQICFHDRNMREGTNLKIPSGIIRGRNVGLLGFGAIGQKIVQYLSGFELKFMAYVKNKNKARPKKEIPVVKFLNLRRVLKQSDFIFVTLPLTPKTKGLLTFKEFKLMKKTALLINVSRAAVVCQKDLMIALKEKCIAGAAIDAWLMSKNIKNGETLFYDCARLRSLENVVLSPYRASFVENCHPHLEDVVTNLKQFAQNGELINIVNTKEGY